ncbi:MAG: NAD-dependent dehydratase [Parcubacteria group bacterium]|nr:NAD-dependent dehydratase [Parcubacteria group bacterium]|tara:strand:+ start:4076 stop:5011 length:936 start_codon:yes stop_codon:yes gene_type:complete
MKILVTGGAGFIGSHLCKFLIDQGNQVVCLDNFFSGQKRNIEPFLNNSNFELMEHDITVPFDVEVEQIYNLACPASPLYYQKNPVETVRTSVLGAINVLDLAKKLGGIKVLQASTSEVYGDPEIHPQTEEYNGNVNPIGPRACYDEGKRCAETLFFNYNREHNIPIKVVRIFNTYGPNMALDDGRVVSNFITQALRGNKLTVHGDGSHTRSFCYVSDMVEGIYKMMLSTDFTGPVNLGNPDEFTIKELAEKITAKLDGSISYDAVPAEDREGDPERRKPDISLAKNKLDWKPNIKLDDGLDKTINYFKEVI